MTDQPITPLCPKCGYDLTGQIKRHMTCSECGHQLTRKQLIISGLDRRARPRQSAGWIAVVWVLVLAAFSLVLLARLIGMI